MPLLFETGAYKLTWPRVLVACDAQTQLQRLMARDASSAEAARARMEAQMPLEAKRKLASVVIDNSGSLEATREQAGPLSRYLVNMTDADASTDMDRNWEFSAHAHIVGTESTCSDLMLLQNLPDT